VGLRKVISKVVHKKIIVEKGIVKLYYNVSVPPCGKWIETMGFLPMAGHNVQYIEPLNCPSV
jgi:hypothetical protein